MPERTPRKRRIRLIHRLIAYPAALILVTTLLSVSGCMERLFYHPTVEETPAPRTIPGAEKVEFNSADGTKLIGWFIPARGENATAPGPAVLHVHGNAGNIRDHIAFTEYLPPAGFHLLIFDYRGYGESDGKPTRRDDLIADTNAALDVLLARPEVDPTRVALYGQSLGGSIGINMAADRPEIHAAVLESAFTSWQDAAASAVGGDPPSWIGRFLAGLLIRDHRRVDEALERFQRPSLLLHGTADRVVPASHSRRLKEIAGEHATIIELEGGAHNTLRDSHPEVEDRVIEFLWDQLQ